MTDETEQAEREVRRVRLINTLLFDSPGGTRFTLDNPVLPMVWLAFANEPYRQHELILTTSIKVGTGSAAQLLRDRLMGMRLKRPQIWDPEAGEMTDRTRARVAYIPGQIAAKVYFDELMRVILPLTPWWEETYERLQVLERPTEEGEGRWSSFPRPDGLGHRRSVIADALMLSRRDLDPTIDVNISRSDPRRSIPGDLLWLIQIGGLIAEAFNAHGEVLAEGSAAEIIQVDSLVRRANEIETSNERRERLRVNGVNPKLAREARVSLVAAFEELYRDWGEDDAVSRSAVEQHPYIWRVTRNRRVHLAVSQSALTVKADAARSLFDISCQDITWAVLDSGIDREHPAFRLTSAEHAQQVEQEIKAARDRGDDNYKGRPLPDGGELEVDRLGTRVVKTLDFTYLRELLDFDIVYHYVKDEDEDVAELSAANERRDDLRRKVACRMSGEKCRCDLGLECAPSDVLIEAAADFLETLRERIRKGQDISWQDLEPAIESVNPSTPTNDHGTHVAGILAADWIEDEPNERHLPLAQRTRRMRGICPDLNLIDVRVFREDGLTDEFELLAALQFLRWMNSRAGTMQVHGANLSLSLIHEVRRFACGQTPICQECNESAALGMAIVAAAGNRGFEQGEIDVVRASDGYREVSITDPGNADRVITVGATHRKRPHEYGVSYFSSRGPTGDGRQKPDLVAPGEKIQGPIPNGAMAYKDGTSMAAPHVSGAAALLMARHSELIGQPERIKQILCETATDLGRERYFQGHGLVDVLRAIQSV